MNLPTVITLWWALGFLPILIIHFIVALSLLMPLHRRTYHDDPQNRNARGDLRKILAFATLSGPRWKTVDSAALALACLLLGPLLAVFYAVNLAGEVTTVRAMFAREIQQTDEQRGT